MTLEHREVKAHWLAEKNDLQSRFHQVQALNTQIQGTLKKKEKDFDKLQNQLAKVVKDAAKGQAKPAIYLSVPIKKNLSQETKVSAISLLKDAEVLAARQTISTLDVSSLIFKYLIPWNATITPYI